MNKKLDVPLYVFTILQMKTVFSRKGERCIDVFSRQICIIKNILSKKIFFLPKSFYLGVLRLEITTLPWLLHLGRGIGVGRLKSVVYPWRKFRWNLNKIKHPWSVVQFPTPNVSMYSIWKKIEFLKCQVTSLSTTFYYKRYIYLWPEKTNVFRTRKNIFYLKCRQIYICRV